MELLVDHVLPLESGLLEREHFQVLMNCITYDRLYLVFEEKSYE